MKEPHPHPIIVQILETKFSRNESSSSYKIFASDGELGMFFHTSGQFGKLHSTGVLSVFTIIRIDQYSYDIESDDPNDTENPCFILHLTVLLNGREATRLLGVPTNIPCELNNWLKVFTIKLEKENRMKSKADTFKLNCLNPAKKKSKLTTGCLEKICSKEVVEKPIVQILSLVKIINAEENLIYYSLHLSDGKSCFNRVFTRSFHFNNLVEAGIITKFSIIRLDRYKLIESNTRIMIINLTVMNKGTDVKTKIGKTIPIKLHVIQDVVLDRLDAVMEEAHLEEGTKILSLACLLDIQREIPVDQPFIQILIANRYGLEYGLEISDALFKVSTEVMDDEICETIINSPHLINSIIRLDEYEVSFVRETFECYKPILHIKKVTFVHQSNAEPDNILGTPVRFDVSKKMSAEDYVFEDIEEEESEQPATTSTSVPEKPIFAKGFLNKAPVVEEDSDEKKRRLSEEIRTLTAKEKVNNQTIDIFQTKMSKLADKNTLLKKRLEKFNKTMLKDSQKLLLENFEIVGVEKKPNEDLKLILQKILRLISANLNMENDIVSIVRCGKTGNILAKCRNKDVRQKVIVAKRGIELTASLLHLDLMSNNICINEHLTPFNKVLLIKAKALKNEKVFDYAWVKNGHVYARSKNLNDNKCIHIYSMDQIKSYGPKPFCL